MTDEDRQFEEDLRKSARRLEVLQWGLAVMLVVLLCAAATLSIYLR